MAKKEYPITEDWLHVTLKMKGELLSKPEVLKFLATGEEIEVVMYKELKKTIKAIYRYKKEVTPSV